MKITIVCDVLGAENNGTSVAATNLINFMKEAGHEVKVVCPDKNRQGQPGYYIVPELNLLPPLQEYVKKVGVDIATPDKKIIIDAIEDADVVHIMTPFLLGTAAVHIADELGKPITAGFHCQAENLTSHFHLMNVPLANDLTYKIMYNIFYRHVDCVHYPTKFIRDIFENEVGPTNGCVISNGVAEIFYEESIKRPDEFKDKFVILSTGRYAEEKSQHIIIDAVKLSRHEKDIQLIIAGGGPLEQKLRDQGKKLINPPLLNFYKREELVEIENYADLYVHAAEVDLEAIACIEAIACGLVPVIANSPKCATKNFALSENNLFEYNNPESLAEKIDFWIEHPEERAASHEQYLSYADEFKISKCMKKMEEMFVETKEAGHQPARKLFQQIIDSLPFK